MKRIFFTLVYLSLIGTLCAQPAELTLPAQVPGTALTLTQLGKVTLEGVSPSSGSWVGVFDEDWNLAGASSLFEFGGESHLQSSPVYESDASISFDGIDCQGCETFTFILWDAASDKFYIYPNKDAIQNLDYMNAINTPTKRVDVFEDFNTIWNFTGAEFNLSGVLPVELVYFRGKLFNNQANLTWATASEINSEKFEIEYSVNGQNYKTIGEVTARGNTLETTSYNFIHKNVQKGSNYYRLKQIDVDGRYEYSKVIVIEKGGINSIISYPNPVINVMSIETETPIKSIQILDINGRLVQSKKVMDEALTQQIDLIDLPKGTYLLDVEMEGGSFARKIIKE